MKAPNGRGLIGIVMIGLLWQAFSMLITQRVFPGPGETILYLIDELGRGLLLHMGASLSRIAIATIVSILFGLSLGLAAGRSRHIDGLLSPPVYVFYPLPKIAFLPVLMILFGLGNLSKITLIILVIVLQIFITVRDSVRRIPDDYFLSAASLGLSGRRLYRHLILPAILPALFSTLRVSLGISFSVLFFAENYATRRGIGFYIMDAWSMINYPKMFAGILILGITGFLLYKLIDFMEALMCHPRHRRPLNRKVGT